MARVFANNSNLLSTRPARAFTLIEVMLAVVIMGLGVLGLSALFAGAASQQQRSNEVNLSVGTARNAEALLGRNFGLIDGPDFTIAIKPGQWYAVPSKDGSTGQGRGAQDWSLTLDPLGTGGLYFIPSPREPDFDAFTNPGPMPAEGLGRGDWDGGQPFPMAGTSLVMSPLPHSRIHPSTFSGVEVTIGPGNGPHGLSKNFVRRATGPSGDVAMKDRYQGLALEAETSPMLMQAALISAVNPDLGVLKGQMQALVSPGYEYMIIDLGEMANGDPGKIAGFHLELDSTEWIAKIQVRSYERRDDTLVSLNDRMVYEPDDRFPGGQRPVLAYTALFRTLGSGATSQLTIFTYALQPSATPVTTGAPVPFAPPESHSVQPDRRLLRLLDYNADVRLGYDPNAVQYFVSVPNDDSVSWVAAPGQILMVSKSLDEMTGLEAPGSDIPVRVTSQQPDTAPNGQPNGRLRGVLDRGPRVNGKSVLPDLGSTIRRPIAVFALNPLVESQTQDRTEWRVRPVEARQFQIATQ